MRNAITS